MAGSFSLTVQDAQGETATTSFKCAGDTAGDVSVPDGQADTLVTAIAAVIRGARVVDRRAYKTTEYADARPTTDPYAERELKWLVRARDTVSGKPVSLTIPTADLDLAAPSTGLLDISAGVGANLVSALEAYMLSDDGQAINVESIILVGRSL